MSCFPPADDSVHLRLSLSLSVLSAKMHMKRLISRVAYDGTRCIFSPGRGTESVPGEARGHASARGHVGALTSSCIRSPPSSTVFWVPGISSVCTASPGPFASGAVSSVARGGTSGRREVGRKERPVDTSPLPPASTRRGRSDEACGLAGGPPCAATSPGLPALLPAAPTSGLGW